MRKKLALYCLQAVKRLSAGREIARYLGTTEDRKLNIGAQTNVLPGWLNVDLLPFPGVTYMDATKRWPLPDGAFDILLCEHMIEHVPKHAAQFVLAEAWRVAAPGARIRVVTPDMTSFARLALDPGTPGAAAYVDIIRARHPGVSHCDIVNMIYYGYGHRYIFSPAELTAMMGRAGFTDIRETRASYPVDPAFRGAEGHPRLLGAEQNAFEAFALEASKAAAGRESGAPETGEAAGPGYAPQDGSRPAAAASEAPTALAYAPMPSSPRTPR